MPPSPRFGFDYLEENETVPSQAVNEALEKIESAAGHIIIEDRDLATPPGSPAQGATYIVAGSPTGAWASHAGDIAYYMNTSWEFYEVIEGFTFWVKDEDKFLVATSSSTFNEFATVAVGTVSTQSGTSYTAVLGDANGYIRFTNASPVTFTIPANASVAYSIGTVIEFEQGGAGAVTVAPDTGVTVNSRSADLTLAGQYAVAFVKKVATNTWTLNGDL